MEIEEMAELFRARFKHLEKTECLTKSKLAKELNTSRPQIECLLHVEHNNVSIDSLLKFAYALKMPITLRLV
jgi:transcriptional regulator with XRE-family HTH domain